MHKHVTAYSLVFDWGIRAKRCITAFLEQYLSTQHQKDYNIWANSFHPCFHKNEMALLVTFCIQISLYEIVVATSAMIFWEMDCSHTGVKCQVKSAE